MQKLDHTEKVERDERIRQKAYLLVAVELMPCRVSRHGSHSFPFTGNAVALQLAVSRSRLQSLFFMHKIQI